MKITYMTTLGVNVGDEFIRAGLQAVMRRVVSNVEPFYVCKHDPATLTHFVEDETSLLPDKFWNTDLFIQAGAPVFWKNRDGQTSLTSVWHKELWEDRILKGGGPMFLNLGAGSCFEWGSEGNEFIEDPQCMAFARAAGKRAALTVVRDSVAARICGLAGVDFTPLVCPAFLAATDFNVGKQPRLIGVNLMRLGCHHDLKGDFFPDTWACKIPVLLAELRKQGRLIFIAHDLAEVEFMTPFCEVGERIFHSPRWVDYLPIYGACEKVVANRVHGAVLAAGFGAKAAIIGNDTRALIGKYACLPIFKVDDFVVEDLIEQLNRVNPEVLLSHRGFAMDEYIRVIERVLN